MRLKKSQPQNSTDCLKNKHHNIVNGVTWKFIKYTVTNTTMVNIQKGKPMVLSLLNNGEVWAPDHLKTRVRENNLFETM